MTPRTFIQGLAMLALLVVAATNIIGSLHPVPGGPLEISLAPLIGAAIWALLLWKIWSRPRNWGLGVGIFLFLLIPFQSFLWWLAVNHPKGVGKLGAMPSTANFILLYELPILVAAVSCVLLRFTFPNDASGSSRTPA